MNDMNSTRATGITSLVVAAAILVSTWLAVQAAGSGWLVLAGPLLLAIAIVSADTLKRRLDPAAAHPALVAFVLAIAVLCSATIVALSDPTRVAVLLPVLGAGGWLPLLARTRARCATGARHADTPRNGSTA